MTSASSNDPRAVVEYRVPAASLRAGDLVNLSPGEDDWQQVLGVYAALTDVSGSNAELRTLVETLDKRYVVVELTDLNPVDNEVHFVDGVALAVSADDGPDEPVADVASPDYGVRTYLYTKYELVTIRSA
ncbi:MAG: hypothetical protein JO147_04685 [Actinobacteria bacterium]|nr:hypothetical protein [Actinomycetota bacterium]